MHVKHTQVRDAPAGRLHAGADHEAPADHAGGGDPVPRQSGISDRGQVWGVGRWTGQDTPRHVTAHFALSFFGMKYVNLSKVRLENDPLCNCVCWVWCAYT